MKKTIVYIAPHLSTGGMPQYLYKQMKILRDDFEIYCIEWGDVTGGVLVVQRNKIKSLLGDKLLTLGERKEELFDMIKRINPDVVHLQEIPELFMPHPIAEKLYAKDRRYSIIETSHDSSQSAKGKRFFPDKFLFVSQYQVGLYKELGIPSDVVEYPIELFKRTKTREEAQRELGMNSDMKHIINVGLFTPRKNQAEIIEYAKSLKDQPIQFHFIGNQADNFRYYWEPIMKDFPSNCKWWNERTDVENFYQAADLFLFTSRGSEHDKETMPLVIREAISWQVPSLIYNLPVYENYFDKYKNIRYLDFESQQNNTNVILQQLNMNDNTYKDETWAVKKNDFVINTKWDLEEQKMYYSTETDINFPVIISVKEYKSDAVLWAIKHDSLPAGIQFWVLPTPVSIDNYKANPMFTGIKFCIYKDDDTQEQIYEHPYFEKFVNKPTISVSNFIPYYVNYYEFFVQRKYDKFLNKGFEFVVDVGANVGLFSKYLLENKLAEKIVAIECDTLALKDLKRNFHTNDRVEIIPKAFHYATEPITFYQSKDNPIISSTLSPDKLEHHRAGIKGDTTYTVDTITIEQILLNLKIDTSSKYGKISLLKIDIEGGEYDVIENSKDYLFDHIENLMIECHFFEKDYREKYERLKSKLTRLGYLIEEYEQNQIEMVGGSECIFAKKLN